MAKRNAEVGRSVPLVWVRSCGAGWVATRARVGLCRGVHFGFGAHWALCRSPSAGTGTGDCRPGQARPVVTDAGDGAHHDQPRAPWDWPGAGSRRRPAVGRRGRGQRLLERPAGRQRVDAVFVTQQRLRADRGRPARSADLAAHYQNGLRRRRRSRPGGPVRRAGNRPLQPSWHRPPTRAVPRAPAAPSYR